MSGLWWIFLGLAGAVVLCLLAGWVVCEAGGCNDVVAEVWTNGEKVAEYR